MRPLPVLAILLGVIAATLFVVLNQRDERTKPPPTLPTSLESTQTPAGSSPGIAEPSPTVGSRLATDAPALGGLGNVQFDSTLTGLVKNPQRQAVAGAELILTTYGASEMFFGNEPVPDWSKEPKTTTDFDGRFWFTNVDPARSYSLIVTHTDYARMSRRTRPIPESGVSAEPEIILALGATLTGTIKDEGGNRVNDATLYLQSPEFMSLDAAPDRMTVKSDANGVYAFAHVPSGWRMLTVLASGYGQITSGVLVFEQDRPLIRDITLKIGEMISGRVVGMDNQGLPKATVIAIGASATQQTVRSMVETDAKGEFLIENLMRGDYQVLATMKGFRPRTGGLRVSTNTSDLLLELVKVATVSGQVLDGESGQPVHSFSVRMRSWYGPGSPTSAASEPISRDDPAGKFCIEDVAPGDFVVEAVAPGYAPTLSPHFDVHITKPVDGITVRLTHGGSISGRVLDPDGNPVARARVVRHDSDWADDPFIRSGRFSGSLTVPDVRTGDDGRFTLSNLNTGTYEINIMAPNFARFVRRDLSIADGVVMNAGDIRLQRGGTVHGMLYDASGKPIPGGQVNLQASNGDYSEYKTKSDDAGRFVLHNCAPGRYFLSGMRSANGDMSPYSGIGDTWDSQISIIVGEGDVTTQDLHLR